MKYTEKEIETWRYVFDHLEYYINHHFLDRY